MFCVPLRFCENSDVCVKDPSKLAAAIMADSGVDFGERKEVIFFFPHLNFKQIKN